jgi:hypothetical protein
MVEAAGVELDRNRKTGLIRRIPAKLDPLKPLDPLKCSRAGTRQVQQIAFQAFLAWQPAWHTDRVARRAADFTSVARHGHGAISSGFDWSEKRLEVRGQPQDRVACSSSKAPVHPTLYRPLRTAR